MHSFRPRKARRLFESVALFHPFPNGDGRASCGSRVENPFRFVGFFAMPGAIFDLASFDFHVPRVCFGLSTFSLNSLSPITGLSTPANPLRLLDLHALVRTILVIQYNLTVSRNHATIPCVCQPKCAPDLSSLPGVRHSALRIEL